MFAKQKSPEPTPNRREYDVSGPVPVVRGRRPVQGTIIAHPWNQWEEQTSAKDAQPRAVYYSIAFEVCQGPVRAIRAIYLNGRRLGWLGNPGYNLPVPFKSRPSDPEDPEYWSAPFSINIHYKHTPVQGRIYWGDPMQPADPLLSKQVEYVDIVPGSYADKAHPQGGYGRHEVVHTGSLGLVKRLRIGAPPQAHPPYAGRCYVVFYAYETDFAERQGGTAIGDIQFEVEVDNEIYQDPKDFEESGRYGVNPVATVADLLKNPRWGLGLPDSLCDTATLIAAAQRYRTEGFYTYSPETIGQSYLSPILAESRSAADLLGGLLDYIDGYLRVVDGKLTVDWFPNKRVDPAGLPEIDRSMMAKELKTVRGPVDTMAATKNEVTVDFTDGTQLFGNSTRKVRNPANRDRVREPRRMKLSAKQAIWPETAQRYAGRKLAALAEPAPRYRMALPLSLAVDGDGAPLLPGAQFIVDYEPWGLDLVVRVIERDEQGDIAELELMPEPGNYPLEYVPAEDPIRLPDAPVAAPFTTVRVWQLPTRLGGVTNAPHVAILARREHNTVMAAEVYFSRTGAFAGEEQRLDNLTAFAGYATLTAGINAAATSITLESLNAEAIALTDDSYTDAERDNDTVLALIDNELVTLGQLESPSDTTRTYSILRGRQGTAAVGHDAATPVWLFRKADIQRYLHEAFRLASPYNTTAATSYWRLAPVTIDETGAISPSFQLIIANPFPSIALLDGATDRVYGQTDTYEAQLTGDGRWMRYWLVLYGPSGEQIGLVYDESNLTSVALKAAVTFDPAKHSVGTWVLAAWAAYVENLDGSRVVDADYFNLAAPLLGVDVNTHFDSALGKTDQYQGTITNPSALPVSWVMFLQGPNLETIVLANGTSAASSITAKAQHKWTTEASGNWTLYLGALHVYQGASGVYTTDTDLINVAASPLSGVFNAPADGAVLLHRANYDVQFTVTNNWSIPYTWTLLYEGPELSGKRRNVLIASGASSASSDVIVCRLDTSKLDLYTLAQQAASPYRLKLSLMPRLGAPKAEVTRNFTVSLPQPLSAHFGEKTATTLAAEGQHLRDGDIRSESGAEWRYAEASTAWKRQTAITLAAAARPDGVEVDRSNYTSGVDNATAFSGVMTANQTVMGSAGWLRYYANAANDIHGVYLSWPSLVAGRKYRVRLKLYLPTGQSSASILIALHGQAVEHTITAKDEVQVWEATFTSVLSTPVIYLMLRATFAPFVGANSPTNDYFYIKDFALIDITGNELYRSNFSSGVDGWIADAGMAGLAVQDGILGVDDVLTAYRNTEVYGGDLYRVVTAVVGRKYRVRFYYYIPAGQTNVNGLVCVMFGAYTPPYETYHYGPWPKFNAVGSWQIAEFEFTVAAGIGFGGTSQIRIYPTKNEVPTFVGANATGDDRIYFKDFTWTDITDIIEPIANDRWLDTTNDYRAYKYNADLLSWDRDNTTLAVSRLASGIIETANIVMFGGAQIRGVDDEDTETGGGFFIRGEYGGTKSQWRVGSTAGQHILYDGQTGQFRVVIGTGERRFELDNDSMSYGTRFLLSHDTVANYTYLRFGANGKDTFNLFADDIYGAQVNFWDSLKEDLVFQLSRLGMALSLPLQCYDTLQIGSGGTPTKRMRFYEASVSFSVETVKQVTINISGHGFTTAPDYVFCTIVRPSGSTVVHRDFMCVYLRGDSSSSSLVLEVFSRDGANKTGTVYIQVQAYEI